MPEHDRIASETLVNRAERGDVFTYRKATEENDPDFALLARQVHWRSYRGEAFLNDNAVDEHGQVVADIDKARGVGVEYYLGSSKEGVAVSTLRKVDARVVGGVERLPGYKLTQTVLFEEGDALLRDAELDKRPIKEITSFGHIPEVSNAAGLELLRHALQEAHGTTGEVWFFAMVKQKYQRLVHLFGPRAVRQLGDAIALDDDRVGDVSLVPAYVDTATFFDDIAEEIVNSDPQTASRLLGMLRMFTKGVDTARLSEDVRTLLGNGQFSVTDYIATKEITRTSPAWEQPRLLDFNSPVDKVYARRIVDASQVQSVVDRDWREEFSELPEGSLDENEGKWVHYPWNKSLVHFPDQDDYFDMLHSRDRHLVSAEEQRATQSASALYAGMSVGSHILEHMTYSGVVGSHTLADFDEVSISNLNRIHAGMGDVGSAKLDVFAKKVSELNPYVRQTLLREGITSESLRSLATPPDIIFDAVDDLAAKALLRVYAKEQGIPVVMASDVGYKSIIDVERHDIGGVKPFNGRLGSESIEKMLDGELTEEERKKIITQIIGLSNASFRLLQSVRDPALTGFPQLEVTAAQGGSLATIVARDILLGRDVPSGRRVHDARKAMKLPREESLVQGMKTLISQTKR